MEMTELEEYQEFVKGTTYGNMRGVELLVMSNALGGECGELMNVVKKIYRDTADPDDAMNEPLFREQLISEMGDVLWYLAAIGNAAGISLDDVMIENIRKLNERQSRQV